MHAVSPSDSDFFFRGTVPRGSTGWFVVVAFWFLILSERQFSGWRRHLRHA